MNGTNAIKNAIPPIEPYWYPMDSSVHGWVDKLLTLGAYDQVQLE